MKSSNDKKDLVITRHNSLVEGSYKLNLDEQRLLYLCITQLDPRKPLPKDNSFTVTAKEFAETFSIDEKSVYQQIEEASKSLSERWLRTNDVRYREQLFHCFLQGFLLQYLKGSTSTASGARFIIRLGELPMLWFCNAYVLFHLFH